MPNTKGVFSPDYNVLNYLRVVRKYFQKRYNLSQFDLETCLFLYSERYFDFRKFREYARVGHPINRKYVKKLEEDGWIELYRMRKQYPKEVWRCTHKLKKMVNTFYKTLYGEYYIPEDRRKNPFFLAKWKQNWWSQEVYKEAIMAMNDARKGLDNVYVYEDGKRIRAK